MSDIPRLVRYNVAHHFTFSTLLNYGSVPIYRADPSGGGDFDAVTPTMLVTPDAGVNWVLSHYFVFWKPVASRRDYDP